MPAQAGIQVLDAWIPAFKEMTTVHPISGSCRHPGALGIGVRELRGAKS